MVKRANESGQVLPILFICVFVLCLFWIVLINVGKLVKDRMVLQNAADNSATSIAILRARALNNIGKFNMTLGLPGSGTGLVLFGVSHVWVPWVPPNVQKRIVEGIITLQVNINKVYGGESRVYFANNYAKRQELDAQGEGIASDFASCVEGFSLNLEPNKGDIWYWSTVESPWGPLPCPPIVKVRNTHRWYMQKDEFYKQKTTVVAVKKADSKTNKGLPFGGGLIGLKKWVNMEASASAAVYNTRGAMFPRKGDNGCMVSFFEYFRAFGGGWEAHLVPMKGLWH